MIEIFPTEEELFRFAAERFVEIGNEAIEDRGFFSVALAGGSTPKSLYRLLASERYKNEIDWTKCFFFFGDERNVPPDDADSNFRMAKESLFEPLGVHESNIKRWRPENGDAARAAEEYETTIRAFFRLGETEMFPRVDLILLGMGDDGHTASLFPFSPALKETERIAVANPVDKLATTRLTLTFPAINNARNVVFLVKGADKAETVRQVLRGRFQPDLYPSQNVKPPNGELFWLLDEAAARFI